MMRCTDKSLYLCCFILLFSCKQEADHSKLFTRLASADTGIRFKNLLRETEEFNVMKYSYFYNGSGVAVGDINNDRLPDIYFTGNMMASHLYLNKGNGETAPLQFEEIAEKAGVSAAGLWNTGVTMADVNGDGWLDIYVCRSAAADPVKRKNLLFINNKDLTFTEKAASYGLADPAYSTQASFFDYDRDGDLDMYLLNHSVPEFAGFNKLIGNYKQRKNANYGDKLYRNDGERFTDVTDSAGIIHNVLGFGLGVTVTDVNGDHWPDIYISNDYNEEDYLYLNQQNSPDGHRGFKESLRESMGHVSLFSMGADGADINNDLKPDLITLDMLPESSYKQKKALGPEHYDKYQALISSGFYFQTMRNMLQLNKGNGPDGKPYFSEIGQLAGISNTDWSWAVLAADYDNDGYKDLLVTNGYMRNYLDMDFLNYLVGEKVNAQQPNQEGALLELIEKMPPIKVENYLYKNNGGLTFTKTSEAWGMGEPTVSNGAAYADLDNDGDLDLIICNTNEEAGIFQNNSDLLTQNHYLKVRLQGKGKNTFGVGAQVMLYAGAQQFLQEMIPVRGFQSSVNYELVFGLGEIARVDSLTVIWPDATVEKKGSLQTDQTITLQQTHAQAAGEQKTALQEKNFTEEVNRLGLKFRHEENSFLDFKRDRMMPHGISTAGPKITRGDINQDGREDVYVGGAKGSTGKLFVQLRNGSFKESPQPAFDTDKGFEDTDGVLADVDGDGDLDLYVVSGGNEFTDNGLLLQDRLYLNNGKGTFTRATENLPDMLTSSSSVTVADIEQDGDLDLFVGGRSVPGAYPVSPRSYLLLNDGKGNFEDATQAVCPALLTPGMVTDAAFLDVNNDNRADLVIAGEWMPLQVYLNEQGKLTLKQDAFSTPTSGWWNTLEAHDFDKDGDLDLVAGNFGLNNPYKPSEAQPARLVYKDFDGNGSVDPIFTYYIADTNAFAYSRDELIGQIASIKKNFTDYESFAKARPENFFSAEQLAGADTLSAVLLETVYLENDGKGNFSVKQLPVEAQFSPIYALSVTDINGDGNADILTGGNLSNTRVSTGKYDGNYGTVLLGDGAGGFTVMNQAATGLKIQGDVRDIEILTIQQTDFALFSRNNDSLLVYQVARIIRPGHLQ